MDYRIKNIIVEIENNLSQTLAAKDLAERFGVSVSHFQHLFKQAVGMSIAKYVKELRLEKAREFLETTDLRINEIRYKVGLSDDSHFVRDFKLKFGATPGKYRKNFHK